MQPLEIKASNSTTVIQESEEGKKEKVACSDQPICGCYARIEPTAQRFREISSPSILSSSAPRAFHLSLPTARIPMTWARALVLVLQPAFNNTETTIHRFL